MPMTKDIAKDRIGLYTQATILSLGILLWCFFTLNGNLREQTETDLLIIYVLEGVLLLVTAWNAGKIMQCLAVLLDR